MKYTKLNKQQTEILTIDEDETFVEEIDMELGEYLLHIYIMETTGLAITDLQGNSDVSGIKITVKAFDDTKYSEVQKDVTRTSHTFWGEHFFFNKKFQNRYELENAQFEIIVNKAQRNSLKIGSCSGSLVQVYSKDDHTILNKWQILTFPEKNFTEIMGYIKFGINFIKSGQKRTNLEAQDLEKKDNDINKISIPPNIKLKKKQLLIKVYKGERLIGMDIGGKADPYIKFILGGVKIKTSKQKDTLEPIYFQKLYIPTVYPNIVNNMQMILKDHDLTSKNDVFGANNFLLQDIIQNKYKEPKWVYFYGAYKDNYNSEAAELMNNYSNLASRFKGAILLSIIQQDFDTPIFSVKEMTEEESKEIDILQQKTFTVRLDFFYVQNLKGKIGKYSICVNWGGKEQHTAKVTYNSGVLQIFERVQIQQNFQINPNYNTENDLYQQLPDIIVSIVYDDDHLAYYRFPPSKYIVGQIDLSQMQQVVMIADNSVSDLPDHYSGILSCKVGCGQVIDKVRWPEAPNNKYEKVYIVCEIYQAKDLVPSDKDGSADPFVQIYQYGNYTRTSVFPKTLNPSWNQRLVCPGTVINNEFPPIVITITDYDESIIESNPHDYMGQVVVNLTQLHVYNGIKDIKDSMTKKWYTVKYNNKFNKGKIYCGFCIVKQDQTKLKEFQTYYKQLTKIEIPSSIHYIRLNLFALRNLQSSGLFPIKKVQLKINTSSLKEIETMEAGQAFQQITINSKSPGKNPSLGTVVNFKAYLADNINNMQSISVQVLDQGMQIFKSQSIIGTFQFILGTHALETLTNIQSKLMTIKEYLKNKNVPENQQDNQSQFKLSQQERANNLDYLIDQVEKEIQLQSQEGGKEYQNDISIIREQAQIALKKNLQSFVQRQSKRLIQNALKNQIIDKNQDQQELVNEEDETKQQFYKPIDTVEYQTGQTNLLNQIANQNYKQSKIAKDQRRIKIIPEYQTVVINNEKKLTILREQTPKEVLDYPDDYIALGYNSKSKNNKQYRIILNESLGMPYLEKDSLTVIPINRGKFQVKKKGFLEKFFSFEAMTGEEFRQVGKFKGIVQILNRQIIKQIQDLDLHQSTQDKFGLNFNDNEWGYSDIEKQLLTNQNCTVIVYLLKAQFHESLDFKSKNDSYFTVQIGDKKVKSKQVIPDDNEPEFFEVVKIDHIFPGASDLVIQFWDEDILKKDDLIGESVIDVERRFFDQKWRSYEQLPAETQDIIQPSTGCIVGNLKLMVDIISKNEFGNQKKIIEDISPRPPTNLILRIVIWEVYDVPDFDIEDVSDIYVSVALPSYDLKGKTDTHYRAQDNFGSFNWRIVFKIQIKGNPKREKFRLDFKVYDKDFLSGNDFIAQVDYPIYDIIEEILQTETRNKLFGPSFDDENKNSNKFVINAQIRQTQEEIQNNKEKKFCKIICSIDCLTEKESEVSPAGSGRSDPNQDPYLPSPHSRFVFSWNPLKIASQLCGPQFKKRLCWMIVIALIVIFVVVFLPTLIAVIIGNMQQAYAHLKNVMNQVPHQTYSNMLNILQKLLNNIINKPQEDKYRTIKKTNKVLQNKLFIDKEIDNVLVILGFIYDSDDQLYLYAQEDIQSLTQMNIIFDGLRMELEAKITNANVDQNQVQQRNNVVNKKLLEKQKEMEYIKKQMMQDRADKAQDLKDRPIQGSKGKELQFGAKIKKCSDILPPPSQ